MATNETQLSRIQTTSGLRPQRPKKYEIKFERRNRAVDVVLHVGVPKTATTTLQMHLFPKLPDILYLGRYGRVAGPDYFLRDEIRRVILTIERSGMDYVLDAPAARKLIENQYDASKHRAILLSNEGMSTFTGVDPMTKLRRYQTIFDRLKVIYCLRDQLDLLESMFLIHHHPEHFNMRNLKRQSWTPNFDQWMDIQFRYAYEALLDCFKFQTMIDR
jgi:hypothetical protein